MAHVSHVLPPCLTGGSLPEVGAHLLGFVVQDLLRQPSIGGIFCGERGRNRAPRGTEGGDCSVARRFKRGKRGNGQGYRSPFSRFFSTLLLRFFVLLWFSSAPSFPLASSLLQRGTGLQW